MKISNVKRSHHLKNKKNYAKPTKKKQSATADSKSTDKNAPSTKKVFGRPSVDNPRKKNKKKLIGRGQSSLTLQTNGTGEAETEQEAFEDMLDMMDEEDRAQIEGFRSAQKRKRDENDDEMATTAKNFEKQFAHDRNEETSKKKRTVDLLPIKTKLGDVITRSAEVDIVDDVKPVDDLGSDDDEDAEEEIIDSDDDIINDKVVWFWFQTHIRVQNYSMSCSVFSTPPIWPRHREMLSRQLIFLFCENKRSIDRSIGSASFVRAF